jgi:hypothetical protein
MIVVEVNDGKLLQSCRDQRAEAEWFASYHRDGRRLQYANPNAERSCASRRLVQTERDLTALAPGGVVAAGRDALPVVVARVAARALLKMGCCFFFCKRAWARDTHRKCEQSVM